MISCYIVTSLILFVSASLRFFEPGAGFYSMEYTNVDLLG